jgi:hypothetical protein
MPAPERQGSDLIHSFLALRKAVGWIAMALPFALLALHRGPSLTSISQSYYRDVNALFVGFLCAIGVFLLFYRGYDGRDRTASFIAGICAIVVSQVPCGSGCRAPALPIASLWQWQDAYPALLTGVHFGSAAVMFAALAYFCFFLFPETDKRGREGDRKLLRNHIYRACGTVIVATMAVKALDGLVSHLRGSGFLWDVGTFCVESTMILAFGISWAVKGESFPRLNDRDGRREDLRQPHPHPPPAALNSRPSDLSRP